MAMVIKTFHLFSSSLKEIHSFFSFFGYNLDLLNVEFRSSHKKLLNMKEIIILELFSFRLINYLITTVWLQRKFMWAWFLYFCRMDRVSSDVLEAVVDHIIDEETLGVCFEVHRAIKLRYYDIINPDEE